MIMAVTVYMSTINTVHVMTIFLSMVRQMDLWTNTPPSMHHTTPYCIPVSTGPFNVQDFFKILRFQAFGTII